MLKQQCADRPFIKSVHSAGRHEQAVKAEIRGFLCLVPIYQMDFRSRSSSDVPKKLEERALALEERSRGGNSAWTV